MRSKGHAGVLKPVTNPFQILNTAMAQISTEKKGEKTLPPPPPPTATATIQESSDGDSLSSNTQIPGNLISGLRLHTSSMRQESYTCIWVNNTPQLWLPLIIINIATIAQKEVAHLHVVDSVGQLQQKLYALLVYLKPSTHTSNSKHQFTAPFLQPLP